MNDISIIKNKRFKKEINLYLDDNYIYKTNSALKKNNNAVLVNFTENTSEFSFKIDNRRIIFITFKIDSTYPFKKPKVSINSKDYYYYLKINSSQLKEINYKYICLCCNTILCDWGPLYSINNIMNEILEFFRIKLRLMERFFCKKITDQFFGTYIPIIEFL
jgi:ubiquitin-protein ligase